MSDLVLEISEGPADAVLATVEEAAQLERAGRDSDAEKVLRRVLEADPLHAEAHRRLLALLMRAGRVAETATHAHALVERDPQLAWAWLRLCQALLCAGRDAVAPAAIAV